MFNILTTPSIFQMDRKDCGKREEERRRRERERRRSIRDQDRSDLLSEHRRVVVIQIVERSGGVLGSGKVPTRGRHELPAPSRNLGITRTIVGLGVALAGSGEVPTFSIEIVSHLATFSHIAAFSHLRMSQTDRPLVII